MADFAEYLLQNIDRDTGRGGIPTVPQPELPELGTSTIVEIISGKAFNYMKIFILKTQ